MLTCKIHDQNFFFFLNLYRIIQPQSNTEFWGHYRVLWVGVLRRKVFNQTTEGNNIYISSRDWEAQWIVSDWHLSNSEVLLVVLTPHHQGGGWLRVEPTHGNLGMSNWIRASHGSSMGHNQKGKAAWGCFSICSRSLPELYQQIETAGTFKWVRLGI